MGTPLATWQAANLVQLLPRWQERFFADVTCPSTGKSRTRSCIEDTVAKTTRIEVPHRFVDGKRVNNTCHECCDMGSVGWPGLNWFLRGPPKARGTLVWDRTHRVTDDLKEAQNIAG